MAVTVSNRNQRATELFEELLEKGIQVSENSRGLQESHIAYAKAYQTAGKHKLAILKLEQAMRQHTVSMDLEVQFARALALGDENARSAAMYAGLIKKYPAQRKQWLAPMAWQTLWAGNAQAASDYFLKLKNNQSTYPNPIVDMQKPVMI